MSAPIVSRPPPQERLENWFTDHPLSGQQTRQCEAIRAAAYEFARVIVALTPESADQTVALRSVREAVFWAHASIACGGK